MPARVAGRRDQHDPVDQRIQIFRDDPGIEQVEPIVGHQCRDLAQWIVFIDLIVGRRRRDRDVDFLDLGIEATFTNRNPDFANEGRGGGTDRARRGREGIAHPAGRR